MRKILIFIALFAAIEAQGQVISSNTLTTKERQDVALATVAFGSVTASHTSFLANASALPFTEVDVLNLTDQPITCSYNGGVTDHFVVPAYSSYNPTLGEMQVHHATTIFCKRTSAAPTVGNVYVSAGY
jgi:hypothetical protein